MEITSNYWDFADSLILRKNGGVFAVFEVPSEVLVTIDKRGRERFKLFQLLVNYRFMVILNCIRFLFQ